MQRATVVKARYDLLDKLPGQALHCGCWFDRQELLVKLNPFMSSPLLFASDVEHMV